MSVSGWSGQVPGPTPTHRESRLRKSTAHPPKSLAPPERRRTSPWHSNPPEPSSHRVAPAGRGGLPWPIGPTLPSPWVRGEDDEAEVVATICISKLYAYNTFLFPACVADGACGASRPSPSSPLMESTTPLLMWLRPGLSVRAPLWVAFRQYSLPRNLVRGAPCAVSEPRDQAAPQRHPRQARPP